MQSLPHFLITVTLLSLLFTLSTAESPSKETSIYQVLQLHGLPMGLLPKGITNFSLDASGQFEAFLDRDCNTKFENELHYERNVSGTIKFGQIEGLSGITAQDLFLWFPVIEIRVDIPSSGLIYFNVGVVSKQFSLSSFESPTDCLAVSNKPDLDTGLFVVETVDKIMSGKLRYKRVQNKVARAIM